MASAGARIGVLIPLGVTAAVPGAGRLLAEPFVPDAGALAPPGEHRA